MGPGTGIDVSEMRKFSRGAVLFEAKIRMWTSCLKQRYYIEVSVSNSDRVYVDGVNSQHQFVAQLVRVCQPQNQNRSQYVYRKVQNKTRLQAAGFQPWQIVKMELYQK
jgi:hypothetical protein